MKLPSGWYAILEAREVQGKKPLHVKRFGLPLVAWRKSQGQIVVMSDLCPHRRAKLSLGKIVEDEIECPFHGFRFGAKGACQWIPEIEKAAPGISVASYPVVENHGLIWLHWRANEDTEVKPPWFTKVPKDLYSHQYSEIWPVHFTRSVENQLDYAHLSFVHRTSIGRFFQPTKKPFSELEKKGLKYYFNESQKSFIEFLFPNIWLNHISSSYMITVAFAPIDEEHTKLYLQVHRSFVTWPPFSWLINLSDIIMNRWVLSQDRRVVVSQEPGNTLEADEQLVGSDQFIRHFRKWLAGKTQ